MSVQHIVDPNDNGGEKGGDNTGDTAAFIDSGTHQLAYKVAGGAVQVLRNGQWAFPRLKVGMKPGFNYRVAVAFRQSDLGLLQVTNKSGSGYVPPSSNGVAGFKGAISPMLTVWRRLNIEIDSMEAVPANKPAPDRAILTVGSISGNTVTAVPVSEGALSEQSDFYNNGRAVKNGKKWEILSYNAARYAMTVTGSFELDSPPSEWSQGDTFEVYDDDDNYLAELGLPPPLPRNHRHAEITNGIREVYAAAYIEIVDANAKGWNPRQTIPFQANAVADLNWLGSIFDDAKDLPNSATFWACTVTFGYQGGVLFPWADDNDPESETPLKGGYAEGDHFCAIFLETIRDDSFVGSLDTDPRNVRKFNLTNSTQRELHRKDYLGWILGVVAHEIGHAPGSKSGTAEHNEGRLMQTARNAT